MSKKEFLLPILFFVALFWGCNKKDNPIKPNPKPIDTDFADTTFSNWEFLGKDYPAVTTYFSSEPGPDTHYLLADNLDLKGEIIIWFIKRPTVNRTYKLRDLDSLQTDTTCVIGVAHSGVKGIEVFYSGNVGTVKVTVPNGKVIAYFSHVPVAVNDSTTNVSGYLVEQ